jgi:hypothetical protein
MNGSSADASIDLELNAKQLYSELAQAERKYKEGMARIGASTGGATRGFDNLQVKTRSASRSIHTLAADFASGADASQLLSDGLMGIGKSLNLSLGALAAFGIGAVLAGHLYKAWEAAKTLRKEVAQIGVDADRGHLDALDTLIARLETIRKKNDELNASQKSTGFWSNIMVAATMFTGLAPVISKLAADRDKEIDREKGVLDPAARGTREEIARRRVRGNEVLGMPKWQQEQENLETKFNDQIRDTGTPGSKNENQNLSMALRDQLAIELRSLLQSVVEKAKDKIGLTLADVAQNSPGYDQEGGTVQTVYARDQARKVLELQAQAHHESLMQHFDRAAELGGQAEDIRNSIPGLKSNEKSTEFKDALEASQRLANIDKNTAQPLVNK